MDVHGSMEFHEDSQNTMDPWTSIKNILVSKTPDTLRSTLRTPSGLGEPLPWQRERRRKCFGGRDAGPGRMDFGRTVVVTVRMPGGFLMSWPSMSPVC